MKLKIVWIILFSWTSTWLHAQVDVTNFDYSRADSIAINFSKSKKNTYINLTNELQSQLYTEHEKFRVIFRWITDNISYSYTNKNSGPDQVLKKGKAVCSGYSNLLQKMCESAGLECVTIDGYSKVATKDFYKDFKNSTHSWNAIKLYGQWYLVDVTWAAGYVSNINNKFTKEYSNVYFLTPPDFFYKQHFPENNYPYLPVNRVKKKDFLRSPIYYKGILKYNISELTPLKAKVSLKLKHSLDIYVHTVDTISEFSISFDNSRYSKKLIVTRQNGLYLLKYKFDMKGKYIVTVFGNNEAIASYKFNVN